MHPTHRNSPAQSGPHRALSSLQSTRSRSDESWIEVSSQPSSSSVSSAADEIITDGLRVQSDLNHRRRRPGFHRRYTRDGAISVRSSSHDEEEESESESDQIMSSSVEMETKGVRNDQALPSTEVESSTSSENLEYDEDDEDDDDENSTAINFPRGNTNRPGGFTPQPNAFSHPPAPARPWISRNTPTSDSLTYDRSTTVRPTYQRHSHSSQEPQQHSPYNVISPSYAADHDAALRASLSTLLSCAAAARGLPRSSGPSQQGSAPRPGTTRVDSGTLRMVPESVALGSDDSEHQSAHPPSSSSRPSKSTQANSSGDEPKAKAMASSAGSAGASSKDRRTTNAQAKKQRKVGPSTAHATAGIDEISPTLMTWVLSAGVVVLVSALTFSAGYVVGREAGRTEALGALTEATNGVAGRCAGEVVGEVSGNSQGSTFGALGSSWRRLRWGSASVGGVTG